MNSTSSIESRAPQGRATLQPWQFYMTASFLAAAAAVWLSPPTTPIAMILLSLAIAAAGACATALHAVLMSFAGTAGVSVDVTEAQRTALEREKLLALRAIKDLQFDAAMGKVSAADAAAMEGRLRERAAAIMQDLDSREGARLRVERELAERATAHGPRTTGLESVVRGPRPVVCAACAAANDADAKFCKGCGAKL